MEVENQAAPVLSPDVRPAVPATQPHRPADDSSTPGPAQENADDPPSETRQLRLTWLLAAAMATAAVLLALPGWLEAPQEAVPDIRWCVLVPLFALVEVVVIHLPTQR